MRMKEVIKELLELIDDRKSFITKDDQEANEIYLKDIQALQIAINIIREKMKV